MSALEYINASLLLLHDKSAYVQTDRDYILKHILAISTDALARPWLGVRRWSQYIWDQVDKGRCTWDNNTMIQDERIRISYTNGTVSHVASSISAQQKSQPNASQVTSVALCREFNAVGGCCHHGSHETGQVRYLHSCAFCDSMGRKSSHSFQKCRLRQDQNGGYGNQNGSDQRYWQTQQSQSQRNNGKGFIFSKNE